MSDETGMVMMPRGNVQEMLDIITGSLDFGSDFLDQEQIEILRSVAEMLGLDPMVATPSKYSKSYPHAYEAYFNTYINKLAEFCRWCSAPAGAVQHHVEPETVAPSG